MILTILPVSTLSFHKYLDVDPRSFGVTSGCFSKFGFPKNRLVSPQKKPIGFPKIIGY
jgi:hypothetical protein